jgi:hypothetical protein
MSVRVQSGPGIQRVRGVLYIFEYAVITIAIFAFLVWRYLYATGGVDVLEVLFWVIFPDLAAFIPIGIASKKGTWPAWGAYVYNFFHTILVWVAVFAVVWIILGTPHLELLGWLGHITTDRTVGYGLRETKSARLTG